MKIDTQSLVEAAEQLGLTERVAEIRSHGPKHITAIPTTTVLLDIPDYPGQDSTTYLWPLEDCKAFHKHLGMLILQATTAQGKLEKKMIANTQRYIETHVQPLAKQAMNCHAEGCHRERHFFDDQGNGYCKRHADELGLRPTGKV